MALDIPKVFARAVINTAESLPNLVMEVADPSIKTDPHNLTRARIGDILDAQLPPDRNGRRENMRCCASATINDSPPNHSFANSLIVSSRTESWYGLTT